MACLTAGVRWRVNIGARRPWPIVWGDKNTADMRELNGEHACCITYSKVNLFGEYGMMCFARLYLSKQKGVIRIGGQKNLWIVLHKILFFFDKFWIWIFSKDQSIWRRSSRINLRIHFRSKSLLSRIRVGILWTCTSIDRALLQITYTRKNKKKTFVYML